MSDPTRYLAVEPAEHSPECRRGIDPRSIHFAIDDERCERCAAVWAKLVEQVRQPDRQAAP